MSDSRTTGPKSSAPVIAGRYELLQRVGEGALFDVARARDRQNGQTVAVKILKSALARDRRYAARLVAEAKTTEALEHGHVARVLDSGQDDGSVCIITEYVEGTTLRERIKKTAPMPVAVAVDFAVEIAEALAAAHVRGIVHGDLRPENVLLTQQGAVKVADFAISKAMAASSDLQQNSVLRWVQSASWEAAEGEIPTPASDTYSLGCILYEMLTGSPVFPGENAIVVALRHAKDAPRPLSEVNPSVPGTLSELVMRCLQKDPSARYADGVALLADLRKIQDALRYNKPLDYTPTQVLKPVTHTKRPEREEEYDYDQGDPKIVVVLRALMLMLIGVAAVAVCVFLYNVLQPQKDIVVPEVIGRDKTEAQQILLDKGLQSNLNWRESQRPAGEVLNQDPEPNQSVKPNRTVALFVSKGPQMSSVPALTEMSLDRAREVAAAAGLAVKKAGLENSDDVQKGYVIDQDPPASEQVKPGSTIKVKVSLGPKPEPAPIPPPSTLYPESGVTGAPGGETVTPTGRARSFKVSFQIPASGYEEPIEVQVVVIDDRGEVTVADEQHQLGDVVTKSIDTVGERVRIRVFLNGKLYSEEIK